MRHQEPRSMRNPKFVSVAAKVFTLPQQYPCSRKKNLSTNLRKNKSEIQLKKTKLSRKGKARLLKKGKVATPFRTRKHVQTTAQNKVSKKQMKRCKKCFKPKKRHHGILTASDLWRLNRSSHKFTNTMGRNGKKRKQRYDKVNTN
jgi:hypothetical protein